MATKKEREVRALAKMAGVRLVQEMTERNGVRLVRHIRLKRRDDCSRFEGLVFNPQLLRMERGWYNAIVEQLEQGRWAYGVVDSGNADWRGCVDKWTAVHKCLLWYIKETAP